MIIRWLQPYSRPYMTEPAWEKYVVIWTEKLHKGEAEKWVVRGGSPSYTWCSIRERKFGSGGKGVG